MNSHRPYLYLLAGFMALILSVPPALYAMGEGEDPGCVTDMEVLQEIIEINSLDIHPEELGRQVWANGRLTWLSIGEGDQRIYRLPESFGALTALTHLFLSENHLKSLPVSVGRLVNLQSLYLNDNALESIPASLGNLVRLENLYLNNNNLKEVPASLANLKKVRNLYLNDNQIQELPEEVSKLPAIRNLYF